MAGVSIFAYLLNVTVSAEQKEKCWFNITRAWALLWLKANPDGRVRSFLNIYSPGVHYFFIRDARVISGYSDRNEGKSLPASPVHKEKKNQKQNKRQERPCSNSTWLISCKFFKDRKRAPSTWKVWLISSILQFTTAQLINKMLVHLVRRSNLSTGMNTKSLVLMQWLIRAGPWWTARTHLESDQSKLLISKCI